MVTFTIGIHRGIVLPPADRSAGFDQADFFHFGYEPFIDLAKIFDVFARIKIEAGEHVEHVIYP